MGDQAAAREAILSRIERDEHPPLAEYVIIEDELPADRLILVGVDMSKGPTFSIAEITKFFFARSPHWIRWREKKPDLFVFEGEPVGTTRTESGARRYNLADVEKMAHALAANGAIDGIELTMVLRLVLIQAKMWRLII